MPRTPLVLLTLLASVAAVPANPPEPQPLTEQEFAKLRERVQAKLDDLRSKAEFPGVGVGFALADGRSAGEINTKEREHAAAGRTPATSSNNTRRQDDRHAAITISAPLTHCASGTPWSALFAYHLFASA